ncbi:hypothetical protein X770_30045 [Mesorhizobium sp. LSJC269B00]|nr:hypothetical protein X770_30045 [Mesorhizobium sp. LSJC269B00]
MSGRGLGDVIEMLARNPPLWPAGHLPLKGGDWTSSGISPIIDVGRRVLSEKLPISPLEGEMPGRAEGGGP